MINTHLYFSWLLQFQPIKYTSILFYSKLYLWMPLLSESEYSDTTINMNASFVLQTLSSLLGMTVNIIDHTGQQCQKWYKIWHLLWHKNNISIWSSKGWDSSQGWRQIFVWILRPSLNFSASLHRDKRAENRLTHRPIDRHLGNVPPLEDTRHLKFGHFIMGVKVNRDKEKI